MVMPKDKNCCPVCGIVLASMTNHLRNTHRVVNLHERRLLLNLAARRVNVKEAACPVQGCTYLSIRLDHHAKERHPEVSQAQLERLLDTVRREKTISLLAALRATNPTPPMVSSLDLEGEEEEDEVLMAGAPQEEQEPICNKPECLQRLKSWIDAAEKYKASAEHKERELSILRSRCKSLDRRNRQLAKAAGEVSGAG